MSDEQYLRLERNLKDYKAEIMEYIKTTNLRNDDRKNEINKLKEVLQDLINETTYSNTQDRLLKKLNSHRKTVKDCNECDQEREYDDTNTLICDKVCKASGGETK